MDISLNLEEVQHGVPWGSVLGPLLFLIYINDLSKSVSDRSSPILFAGDTSFIIANPNKDKLKFNTNEIFSEINKWVRSNLLMFNYDKTYFLQFLTKADCKINMQVLFGDKKIATAQSLKFLGLTIDTTFTWKQHISELTTRMNKACYANRSIKLFMSLGVLRSIYFAYVHSVISYGITFWGNSLHSEEIFKVQKRIIRIIMNLSKNASCWQPFRELNILPVPSQYVLSLFLFITINKDQFMTNSQIHRITTRQTSDLYVPAADLTVYQKGVYYQGIKIYNHLPKTIIKDLIWW